jgi:hypothetical protein
MLTLPIDVDGYWRVGMVSFVINGGRGWQVFFSQEEEEKEIMKGGIIGK